MTHMTIGVNPQGKRSILGVRVPLSETEAHWRDFLALSLHARGLPGVKLVVSDAHAGLKLALDARLTGVPWQRCPFQLRRDFRAMIDRDRGGTEVRRQLLWRSNKLFEY